MSEIGDLSLSDPRWSDVLPVLQQLRPHLTPEQREQVQREGEPQGLRFTAVWDAGACVAVAGWRVVATTSQLRKLYVDDLCTSDTVRSHGHGRRLLDHLTARAREAGCQVIDLDSGVQRHQAHRFYLRERMDIVSHHFARRL